MAKDPYLEFGEETGEMAFEEISEEEIKIFWVLIKLLHGFSAEKAWDIITTSAALCAAFRCPSSSQTH